MQGSVYINGKKQTCLASDNRAIHYGDGLFETILIKNGKATLLDLHLQRLVSDASKLYFNGVNYQALSIWVMEVSKKHPNCILKLIISRSQKTRGYAPSSTQTFDTLSFINPIVEKKSPLIAQICQIRLASQPFLAKIKHLNRLEQVLASQELPQGVDEGILFLQEKDQLVETISSNIFIIKNNNIYTPRLDNAGVEGVAKKILLQTANKHNINIKQVIINQQQLLNADMVFTSNSIFGLRAIQQINDQHFKIAHPLFTTLYQQSKQYFIE